MKYSHKYKYLFLPFFIIFLAGCNVNTNPSSDFKVIKQDVANETGFSIISNSRENDSLIQKHLENLLKNDLTEDIAIKAALLNNKKLQATYEKLGFAKAKLAQAKLLKNPIFSLSYKFATQANQFDIINMNFFQNFLEALLIPTKKKLADTELQRTKAFITNQILQVIADTKNAFYNVLFTNISLEVQKKILLAEEAAYEFAEILFDAGNIKALDLTIKKANYAEAKINFADMEVAYIQAKEDLNRMLGLYGLNINWKITKKFDEKTLFKINFKNLENRVIARSLSLFQSKLQISVIAKKYGIDITKTVMSNFTIGPDSEREDNGVWFVGPAFSIGIPIFDFGKAISAAAQAELYQQWNDYIALAIDIRSKTRMARINFLNSQRKTNYYQKVIIPLKEKIHKETFEQYNAMQVGTFDLLQTKTDELMAIIQKLKVQRDYFFAKIKLDLLLSGGDHQDVEFKLTWE